TKACVFILITGTGLIAAGINEDNGIAVISALAAAAVYMAVPERFTPFTHLLKSTELTSSAAPYSAFGKKLRFMSDTIDEMREAVIKTAKALENENIRDISWVYLKASEQVCKYCPSNMKCWGQHYNDTADILNKAVGNLRNGIFVREEMLGGHIGAICPEISRLTSELNRQYAIYCSAESASRKITELRSVLTGQLNATGTMLRKMSDELGQNDTYDESSAMKAERILKESGIRDCSVIAVILNNRLCIDAYGKGELTIGTEELSDRLSAALDRELDLPVITDTADRKHITISERARYDAQIKVFRKNKSGERYSGDTSDCFCDGLGNVYMILSDGMGSGTRARIDSAFSCGMLSKLLKAGIDLDASLEMLNSSLLVKSSDESFATLDLCRIDLCTGNVMMCRAGGASVYIRCGDSFTKLGEEGMPLGVKLDTDYKGRTFRISDGDMIIMTSDGADIDDKWLEKVVMRDRKTDINDIIDTVGAALRLSSRKENEDDITVIGVSLTR
ncbi:MAG: SpoIIE family protein phosphatase, partial [Ruminiclostridium sp.]|nr:SpoIIE family protein phosphatase [Ruminiclostridium sp.]